MTMDLARTAECSGCKKQISAGSAFFCPECGETLCGECAQKNGGVCRRFFTPLDRFC